VLFATNNLDVDWRASLPDFKSLFLWHGVLGERVGRGPSELFTENFRNSCVRCVFLLLPRSAFVSGANRRAFFIKPLIREHLLSLGVSPDEELLEILKRVAEQLRLTSVESGVRGVRKVTIAGLRARNPRRYLSIREMQGDRCGVCGVLLGAVQEELDHVIPFQLVGDIPDGANWQILCRSCNASKSGFLSAWQHPEAMNWVYGNLVHVAKSPTPTTHYTVLVINKRCVICGRGADSAELDVFSRVRDGLFVADHLDVVCRDCVRDSQMVER
jgi:hypothetical protein